jgi:hypothetical protein
VKDRRKNLYCGPDHKLTPTLTALANAIQSIINKAMLEKDGVRLVSGLNYAGTIKEIGIYARTAASEIDKLIMIDNKEVENARKTSKR